MEGNGEKDGVEPMHVEPPATSSSANGLSSSESGVKRPASAMGGVAPLSPDLMKEKFSRMVQGLFQQLSKGCGKKFCTNPNCKSNPSFIPPNTQADLVALAFKLAQQQTQPCEKIEPLDYPSIEKIVLEAEGLGDFSLAMKKLNECFGSIELLSESFYPPSFTPSPNPSLQSLSPALLNLSLSSTPSSIAHSRANLIPSSPSSSSSSSSQSPSIETLLSTPSAALIEDPAIDYEALNKSFAIILKHERLKNCVANAVSSLLSTVKSQINMNKIQQPQQARIFLILLHAPITREVNTKEILSPLCQCISILPLVLQKLFVCWLSKFSQTSLRSVLCLIQDFIVERVYIISENIQVNSDVGIIAGTKVMKLIYEANKQISEPIPWQEFYNDPLNESIDFHFDFKQWKINGFSFCNYPFLLNARTKSGILQRESELQMQLRYNDALNRMLTTGNIFQQAFLILRIHRERLVENTIEQLSRYNTDDLTMALKVQFMGEEAVDEGGPQKEFFQLIVRELFDAKYGMFIHDVENRTYWFSSTSTDYIEFELIGKILGIAIYNSVILDVHFPFVVYKKLKGIPVTFDDLVATLPSLGKGLKDLMAYEGDDLADIFGITFQVSKEVFGEVIVHDLKPDGGNIPVTQENKKEYIELYTKYLLEDSVESQFNAFRTGFMKVAGGQAFELFNADELQLLICGSPDLDFNELETTTKYENGYTETHPVIRYFWEVVHAMTLEQKKNFLSFTTGSDRAPVGGLKDLNLVIIRHGPDSDRLPQAHTCFNYLLLPEYGSLDKLRDRLLTAINNSEGFGMK